MADASGAGVPNFIGARISLLSNANIRYEGTLFTIDGAAATVALQNVKCFGTEDRVSGNDPDVIPASNEVFEFIIFRGKDIKDLHVLGAPLPPVVHAPPNDPAIVSTTKPDTAPESAPAPSSAPSSSNNQSDYSNEPQPYHDQQHHQHHQQQQHHRGGGGGGNRRNNNNNQGGYGGQQGGGRGGRRHDNNNNNNNNNRERRPYHHQPQEPQIGPDGQPIYSGPGTGNYLNHRRRPDQDSNEPVDQEFDFESANARFDKDQFVATLGGDAKTEDSTDEAPAEEETSESANERAARAALSGLKIAPKYDKAKSFFDNLSTDREDREAARPDRRTDAETFGAVAENYRSRHFPRGGGHHGGGGYHRGGGGGGGYHRGGGGGGRRDPNKPWREQDNNGGQHHQHYNNNNGGNEERSHQGHRGGRRGGGNGGGFHSSEQHQQHQSYSQQGRGGRGRGRHRGGSDNNDS